MKVHRAKNDTEVKLRPAQEADSKEIIDFYMQVGSETTYLGFSEGEYLVTEDQQSSAIKEINGSQNNAMVLAVVDDKIAGIGTISSNNKRIKSRHVGILGIVIRESYCDIGIGAMLMKELIDRCKSNGITAKISLTARTDNTRAIALYEKFGFETEGILKKETCIAGKYFDSAVMALMLK